jgi:MYXO-CTERM domain-containing protein
MKTKLRLTATLLFAGISFTALSALATGTQPNPGDDLPACGPADAITGPCDPTKGTGGACSVSSTPGRADGGGFVVPALGLGIAFLWSRRRSATVS